MGIIKYIKDVILITSWLILLFVFSIFILFSQILVLFVGNLIFIYEELIRKRYEIWQIKKKKK